MKISKRIVGFVLTFFAAFSILSIFEIGAVQVSTNTSEETLAGNAFGAQVDASYEVVFVVYPDGRVVMRGALNDTMEEGYPGPWMSGFAGIDESDTTTVISADFAFTVPPENRSQYPFNASDFTMFSEYSGGLLSTEINGSTTFPPYMASEFPLNVTGEIVVIGEYLNNMAKGNVTADILPGFPLGDVEMEFQGNNTYVHFNGSTEVIFGNYAGFGEFNATVLDELLQNLTSIIGGQGPGSLYNMTDGLVKFTMLSNTTTLHNGNATVDFEAKVEGDFIQALVNMTDQPDDLYRMLNATWSSVENASFLLTYSPTFKEVDINLVSVANITDLIDKTVLILPDIPDVPPETVTFIEYFLNTTYCSVESAEFSSSYEDFTAILNATIIIDGDFNAEINYIKSLFLTYGDVPQPSTSQLQTLNETQIDINNCRISLTLNDTTIEVDFSGFAVRPPMDVINATSFQLRRFFNITAGEYEPPGEGERLKVTVEGASNGTHTIRIFRPPTVPEPDIGAIGGMVWNNQSISGLKDLVFQIGSPDDGDPVIETPIHTPETPDDGEAVTVSVNVTDADTGVRPDGVILSYSTDGGETWNNVTMSKATGDTYEGIIPGLSAGTEVSYRIIAYDYEDNEAVENNAGAYYVYTVISEFPTWQIIVLALLLIGAIVVLVKKRQGIIRNRPRANQLFSIFR